MCVLITTLYETRRFLAELREPRPQAPVFPRGARLHIHITIGILDHISGPRSFSCCMCFPAVVEHIVFPISCDGVALLLPPLLHLNVKRRRGVDGTISDFLHFCCLGYSGGIFTVLWVKAFPDGLFFSNVSFCFFLMLQHYFVWSAFKEHMK